MDLKTEKINQKLKEIRTIKAAMTNPEQKKLVALSYYQNNQEDTKEIQTKPFLDVKKVDWYLKKKLVPTNDEYHPSTQQYFK